MHTLKHRAGNVLEVAFHGEATSGDYETLVPRLESEIARHNEIRVIWDMSDLEGFEAKAAWKDLKFDAEHRSDYERVAVVGDRRWHNWATQVFKPFTDGEVKYFDATEREKAERWIMN